MRQKWSNNARTILSQNINPGDTNIIVDDSTGFTSLGGNEFEIVSLVSGSTIEIVKVISRSGTTWIVERAQEGTSGLSWPSGTIVEARVTAGSLNRFSQIEFDPENIPAILKSLDDPIIEFGPGTSAVTGFSCGDRCSSSNMGFSSGIDCAATGNQSSSIGYESLASGDKSLAVGNGNTSNVSSAVSVGNDNLSTGVNAVALGSNNTSSSQNTVSVGNDNTSIADGAVSVGKSCNSKKERSVSIGNSCDSNEAGSIAVGDSCISNGIDSIALGDGSTSNGNNSIAIGKGSVSNGEGSIVLGHDVRTKSKFQFNMGAIPTAQPSADLGSRDPSLFLSTQPTVFLTQNIDLKIAEFVFTMNLPEGMLFYVDEIGFIGKYINTVTVKPRVTIGTSAANTLFLEGAEIDEVASGSRFIFPSLTTKAIGVNMFRIQTTLNAGALEYNGQFYFRGFAVAV